MEGKRAAGFGVQKYVFVYSCNLIKYNLYSADQTYPRVFARDSGGAKAAAP